MPVNVLVDGEQRSMELPVSMLSMRSVKDLVKQRTGAALCITEWQGAPTRFDHSFNSFEDADGTPMGKFCAAHIINLWNVLQRSWMIASPG